MKRVSLPIAMITAGALLVVSGAADAYQTKKTASGATFNWTSLPMKFNIHNLTGPLRYTSGQAAIRNAYKAWSSVSCAFYTSKDLGLVNSPAGNNTDGVNTHVYTPTWPAHYSSALGVTQIRYNPSTGKILDADTVYSPKVAWSTTPSRSQYDVQGVATHEIGHQLGLDHSSSTAATMYRGTPPGNTAPRTLHSDDVAGVCALYPSGKPAPPECTSNGDCAPGETCTKNKCVAPPKGAYGTKCTSNAACLNPVCVNTGSGGVCSKYCNVGKCPNNDLCVPLTGLTAKACWPGTGGSADKKLGEVCTKNADCIANMCVTIPNVNAICSQKCNLSPDNCPTKYKCVAAVSGGGLCIPGTKTVTPPPPTKKNLGEGCAKASDCKSNLCAQVAGKGVCTQTCDKAKAGSCPSGYTCVATSTNQGACVKVATPPPPPPPGSLGATCASNSVCKSKLCAQNNKTGIKFCTELCSPSAGCPAGFDCIAAGANQHVCSPKATSTPTPPTLPSPPDRGCAISGDRTSLGAAMLVGLTFVVFGASARRRRRE